MSDEINQLSNTTVVDQALLSNRSEVNYSSDKFFIKFLLKNQSTDLAVCVEGAWKNYGSWWTSTTALHDVTLRVPKGVM
jgi:hypothetical protein